MRTRIIHTENERRIEKTSKNGADRLELRIYNLFLVFTK
jgi:hypothetical protein